MKSGDSLVRTTSFLKACQTSSLAFSKSSIRLYRGFQFCHVNNFVNYHQQNSHTVPYAARLQWLMPLANEVEN